MRVLSILILAVLLVPLVQGAEPNRSATSFQTAEPIVVSAFSPDGDGFVVGTRDGSARTGSSVNPNQPVWYLYQYRDGVSQQTWTQDRLGASDASDCVSTSVTTDCIGHVRAIDASNAPIGQDGIRFIVVAEAEGDTLVEFHSSTRGRIASVTIANEIVADAKVSGDGTKVVVGLSVPGSLGGAATGTVRLYSWAASTPIWTKTTSVPVTTVDINEDGSRIIAGAGDFVAYDAGGTATDDGLGTQPKVRKLAISDSAAQYAIAGYSTGDVNVYGLDNAGTGFERKLNLRPDSAAVTAVAISSDGLVYAAGDSNGVLRVYANKLVLPNAVGLIAELGPLTGAIAAISISDDGRYMAVAAGSSLHFFRLTTSSLVEYWKDSHSATITGALVSGNGDHVIATVGDRSYTYAPSKDLQTTLPAQPISIAPGGPGQAIVKFKNDGNRDAALQFSVSPPPQWGGSVGASTLNIAPGETKELRVNFVAAADAPAGSTSAELRVQGAGPEKLHTLPITVLQNRAWTVVANGTSTAGIEAGGDSSLLVVVSNLGNAEDETTFNATISKSNWAVSVLPATVRLAPGESTLVEVKISAPSDAKELETGTVELSPVASPTSKLTLSAVVGARFSLTFAGEGPTGSLHPDGKYQFDLTVTNTGNAPDSIRVVGEGLPKGWKLIFPDDPYTLFAVLPGASGTVPVTLEVDDDAEPANYQFRIRATSLGDSAQSKVLTFTVGVEEAPKEKDPSEDGPGAPVFALILGLLGVAAVRRFRP